MTTPVSKLEVLRPVGNLERYSTARNHLGFYTNVAVTATYTLPAAYSRPIRDYVYKACEILIGQHPNLSAIPIGADTNTPYFARLPEVNLDQCVSFQEWKAKEGSKWGPERQAELDNILEVQHNWPFKGSTAPFWRLCIMTDPNNPGNPREFTAVFVYHHSIGDGASGAAFHRTFLDALKDPAISTLTSDDVKSVIPPPNIPLLPSVEELHPMPHSISYALYIIMKDKIAKKHDPGLWAGEKITTPLENRVRHVVISQHGTIAFTKLCRKNRTTVTAALQTLIATALFRNLPEKFTKLHCDGAISCRRWFRGSAITDDSIGNWVQDSSETYKRQDFCKQTKNCDNNVEFSWAEAQRSKRTLDRILGSMGKNSRLFLLKYIKDFHNDLFLSKIGKYRTSSFDVSNLGVFQPNRAQAEEKTGATDQEHEVPRISRVVFSQSASVAGSALEVSAVTGADGCFVLGFSWQKGVVEEELMAAVIDTMTKELAAFAAEP